MKSLNRATLIGNVTRDPEVKYTPQGTAVVSFSIATNRSWKTESGEMKDNAEFHRIVAWDKLAEICGQLLKKGTRVFVEGRIQTRKWAGADGVDKYMTEIVITDMMLLDKRGDGEGESYSNAGGIEVPDDFESAPAAAAPVKAAKPAKKAAEAQPDDDIPF
jgi:single-strand DNA-binding protein